MSVIDTKMIKSAQRVLEVLEFFDQVHSTATVMEISRKLGYPQSSTSELLRCLVALGYLQYDRYERSYEPTARVALIGAWVEPELFRDGALLPLVDAIAETFGHTVFLSTAYSYRVQHVHVVKGTAGAIDLEAGETAPLLRHHAGRHLLATYSDTQIVSAIRRINADEPDAAQRVSVSDTLEDLRALRTRGWSIDDAGELATLTVMLPARRRGQRLALSACGRRDAIFARADAIREIVARAPVPSRRVFQPRQASNDDDAQATSFPQRPALEETLIAL